MLWFDLSTKVRELFLELNQPLIDKIYQQSADIGAINKTNVEQQDQISHLDTLVNDKADGLDVFKRIDERIALLDADRKTVESKLTSDVDKVMAQFEENNFKF